MYVTSGNTQLLVYSVWSSIDSNSQLLNVYLPTQHTCRTLHTSLIESLSNGLIYLSIAYIFLPRWALEEKRKKIIGSCRNWLRRQSFSHSSLVLCLCWLRKIYRWNRYRYTNSWTPRNDFSMHIILCARQCSKYAWTDCMCRIRKRRRPHGIYIKITV